MQSIELVFFDFGGVLAEEGFLAGFTAIAQATGRDPAVLLQQVRDVIFKVGYVYGRCDEATFWDAVRRDVGLEGDPAVLRQEILSRFVPRPWMLQLVRELRARGLQVAVLSDQVNWLDELEGRYGFFQEFHRVFNSYHYGWTKSEPEFFHLALRAMNVAPQAALFIDDAVSNIAVGRQVGVQPILYEDKAGFGRDLTRYFPDITLGD